MEPKYPPEKEDKVLRLARELIDQGWETHQISKLYGVDQEWLDLTLTKDDDGLRRKTKTQSKSKRT